jgi:hypothetical protein
VEFHGGSVNDGTQLTFPVSINGVGGIAVLDTGSRDTKINPRFAAAAGVDPTSAAFRTGDLIYGANSHPVTSRKGPVKSLAFAGFTIKDAQVRVIDMSVFKSWGIGKRPAMIFGEDIMSRYRLVYDHQDKRFWFGPSECARESKRTAATKS